MKLDIIAFSHAKHYLVNFERSSLWNIEIVYYYDNYLGIKFILLIYGSIYNLPDTTGFKCYVFRCNRILWSCKTSILTILLLSVSLTLKKHISQIFIENISSYHLVKPWGIGLSLKYSVNLKCQFTYILQIICNFVRDSMKNKTNFTYHAFYFVIVNYTSAKVSLCQ